MVEIEYDEDTTWDKFEKDKEEIINAYRCAMKAGGVGFSLRFADGDYEIQSEEDIYRFIDMYRDRKRALYWAKKNEEEAKTNSN